MPAELLPAFYALVAALLFAIGGQIQNLGLPHLDSRTGATLSISASAGVLWLVSPVLLEPAYLLHGGTLWFVLIGLFRPALSANLSVMGMRHLGPTLTSTLSSTAPLFGTALGVLWLGEVLTWQTALGTFGIVAAIALLSRRGKGAAARDWPLWALLLPIGAAALRSLGHVISKRGMMDIPDPYYAAMIGFTVSAMVTWAVHAGRKERPVIQLTSPGPRWFLLAGCAFGTAVVVLNHGLLIGDVVTVVPIVAASPIFSLLLSWALFRREKLTATTVVAVFMVVPSVVLIALS